MELVLHLVNVSYVDNLHNLTCVAENEAGPGEAMIPLNIECKSITVFYVLSEIILSQNSVLGNDCISLVAFCMSYPSELFRYSRTYGREAEARVEHA